MILLDTHALLWWLSDNRRLSAIAASAIAENGPVLISPISLWEVALLEQRGRLTLDDEVPRWVRRVLASNATSIAELTPNAAITAARLPGFHGDPADRFIYATALDLAVPLVSRDSRMREYAQQHGDVRIVW